MSLGVRSRVHSLFNPPGVSGSVTSAPFSTYLLSWIIIGVIMPLLTLFFVLAPPVRPILLLAGSILLVVAFTQICLIRVAHQTAASIVLTLICWGMLTWITWVTGGLYSPSLAAQFVIVVLAEMCSGWRTGVLTLGLSTCVIFGLGWAQLAGAVPPSLVVFSPLLYALTVVIYLTAVMALEAVLLGRMWAMQSRLGTQLDERRAAEKRLHEVIDNAPFGAFLCELSDGRLLITQTNRSASTVLGKDASTLVGGPIERAFPAATDSDMFARLSHVAALGGTHDAGAVPFLSGGQPRILDVHAFQVEPGSLAAFFTDVTERRAAELEFHRMAFHDELTELPNRTLLHDRLERALAEAETRNNHVALLFIDLDDFKLVNDRFGHHFGDELLVAVAQRLRGCTRTTDTVARIGGDEFAVIVADIETDEQAEAVARNALECLRDPFLIDGVSVPITASVGVSMTSDDDRSLSTLFRHSDLAMYEAKRAGRDGHRMYGNDAA